MTPPNVRAFYEELGVELPGWPKLEAPVRCFAEPGAHAHGDRSPSCSVNLTSGAWNCHGCGAHGGAYDAALSLGATPRSAMDLMIAHGLAERRTQQIRPSPQTRALTSPTRTPTAPRHPSLAVDEADVLSWAAGLDAHSRLARRLILERAWAPKITRALDIGFDGRHLTIPIRNEHGHLLGLLRYDPFGRRQPKMRAVVGSRLGLIPHPATERSDHVILVEGPPDMLAARSSGLPAIAIPGTQAWHPAWAHMLKGRRVTVVMDCDTPGRRPAEAISRDLAAVAIHPDIVDLWPDRNDGYDLTDRILERRLAKRERPHAVSTVRILLAPHPTGRPRATGDCPAEGKSTRHEPMRGEEGDQWMAGTS